MSLLSLQAIELETSLTYLSCDCIPLVRTIPAFSVYTDRYYIDI